MSQKESLFTRVFYAGIGIGAMTIDKLEKSLSSLFKDKNISLDDFKDSVNKLVKDLAGKKEDLQSQMEDYVKNFVEKFKYAKYSDLEEINKKLDELEKLLEQKLNQNDKK